MIRSRAAWKVRRRASTPPANVLQFRKQPRYRLKFGALFWGAKWPLALLLVSPLVGIGTAWLWNNPPEITPTLALFKSEPVAEQYAVVFGECNDGDRYNCVIDGDTFWLNGEKVRIADINTPEVSEPKCFEEAELGARATQRLIDLLNAGGFSLETVEPDEDGYGRKLRVVTRDGDSLGGTLVDEGLAERWNGYRGSWC